MLVEFELSELSWADSSELIRVEMIELSWEQLIIIGPMVQWCKDIRDTLFFRTMHISDMEWMVLKELTVSEISIVFAYSIQEVTLTLRPKLDCCRLAGGGETDGYGVMKRSYMPLESSVRLSEAISWMTLIKDITFDVKCLRTAFRRVLEKASENRWWYFL